MTPPPALLYSVVLMMDVTICANNIKGHSVKKSHYRGGITNIVDYFTWNRMLIEGRYLEAH